jgi:hypothetical protein
MSVGLAMKHKCRYCHKPIKPKTTKPPQFCSNAHKVRYHRLKQQIIRELQAQAA